jgi:peptidyl-prolyl cis-trans isomerase C
MSVSADSVASTRLSVPGRRSARLLLSLFSTLAREPLAHFFIVGVLLFALLEDHQSQSDRYRIVITPERIRQLATEYRAEAGSEPDRQKLSDLVDRYVAEEVLYREGTARGLDRDDAIVRRRIVQKMQFLEQDLATPSEPTEAQLAAYYRANRKQYEAPATVTFTHVFFAATSGAATTARDRALRVLAHLPASVTRAPDRGDAFPDLYDYANFDSEQVRRLFGDGEISRNLFGVPRDHWAGPFRSEYGWHLVRVQSITPARLASLDEVRDRVRADLIAAGQETVNRDWLEKLRARFTVVRSDRLSP